MKSSTWVKASRRTSGSEMPSHSDVTPQLEDSCLRLHPASRKQVLRSRVEWNSLLGRWALGAPVEPGKEHEPLQVHERAGTTVGSWDSVSLFFSGGRRGTGLSVVPTEGWRGVLYLTAPHSCPSLVGRLLPVLTPWHIQPHLFTSYRSTWGRRVCGGVGKRQLQEAVKWRGARSPE